MYKAKAMKDTTYGIPEYDVDNKYEDLTKQKFEKEQFQYNIGKKKRPLTSKLDMKSDKNCIYKLCKKYILYIHIYNKN